MQGTTQLRTISEVAEQLRKSENQIRWMIHQKTAPKSALVGGRRMFRQADVDAWLERQFEESA